MPARRSIGRVHTAAAADVVLDQLRRAIGLGRFLPGDKLPPERSLADQLGVSRTTLRVALRVLAREGIVEVRRGAKGGITVRPAPAHLRPVGERALEEMENAMAFRLAVERATARLAAARRSPADLRRLRGLFDVMSRLTDTAQRRRDPSNVARFIATDVSFHLAIAAAARHPDLEDAAERALARRYLPFGTVFAALHDDANDGHAEILAALSAGDGGRAEQLMAAHVQRTYRRGQRLIRPAPVPPIPARR